MIPQSRVIAAALALLLVGNTFGLKYLRLYRVFHGCCAEMSSFTGLHALLLLLALSLSLAAFCKKDSCRKRTGSGVLSARPGKTCRFIFALAVLCVSAQAGKYGDSGEYSFFDQAWPTGIFLTWNSSSGAAGSIQYLPSSAGTAVPDEGNGGMTRRVVLAPGSADCVPFPPATTDHRGQEAGIPYDRNVFVVVLAMLSNLCPFWMYTGEFGPNGKMNADHAGLIFMWSDENDPDVVKENQFAMPFFGQQDGVNDMTYPAATIARGAGPVGGLTMVTEIFNGHRVDLLWPGTGPMTDPVERAALKELMQNIDTAHDDFIWLASSYGLGFSGTIITPEAFIADDSIDPCSNNGQGKRVYGVDCIGGHVVGLNFEPNTADPRISAFPASISALTELRYIYGVGSAANLDIPCELGQLAKLKALVWSGSTTHLNFPEDDSCMSGLVSLEQVMFGAYPMNRFPTSFLALPKMQYISLTRAPVAALPAKLSPNMRILRLSNVGASGPLPSFLGSALLEEVILDLNNLELGNASDFDDCPNLRIVDVSHNNLSAAVFSFKGSTNVEAVDISYNSIRGGIPEHWAELQSCQAIRLSHNLIEAPLGALPSMSKLEIVDLSYNRVDDKSFSVPFILWWGTVAPPRVTLFDLSHNLLQQQGAHKVANVSQFTQLNSVGISTIGVKYPYLARLDLSHNLLWGYLHLKGVFYNVDFSYNNITMLEFGAAIDCCRAGGARESELYSIDWHHQLTDSMGLLHDPTGMMSSWENFTIDQALNKSTDFKRVQYIPRYDSFEQVELPAGSSRFPFVCPTWWVCLLIEYHHKVLICSRAGKDDQNPP
jgi:Leucine-rich repeat (LRR) protein